MRKAQPTIELGKVHFEMGYLLRGVPRTWLRPDVIITYPDQPGKRYYEGAPLMVFEIVSEWDTAAQLADKVAQFLENGAREVWVIYPDTREVWLHDGSGPGKTQQLTERRMSQPEVYLMIRRQTGGAGIRTLIGCHTFRATGKKLAGRSIDPVSLCRVAEDYLQQPGAAMETARG